MNTRKDAGMAAAKRSMKATVRRTARRGLTLLEATVSMAIVGIAVMGVFALMTSTQQGNRKSESVNTATSLANDKLEELKAQHTLWERYPASAVDVTAGSVPSVQVGAVTYRLQWALTPDVPLRGMKNIEMTVSWGGGANDRYKLKVDSAIALVAAHTFSRCPPGQK
jgi:type II secretory pathway pseudopilin PulG